MKAERQTDATRLDELASEINRLHDAAISAVRTALQNAIRAGELLVTARGLVPHGSWYGWLQDHTAVGVRQAQRYMKLYRERDQINASSATHLSDALEIVSKPKTKVVHFSADDDNPADDRGQLVSHASAQEFDKTSASNIREIQAPSTVGGHENSLDRPVDERRQERAAAYQMQYLMSVDGLFSLVTVWNRSSPDARRKFIEMIDGDISDILIERQ
jgi:hypothetical protein